jgi:CBS domain-containing protein
MANVSDIMSTEVQTIEPLASLRSAAQTMLQQDIGALPVCQGKRLLGMLTDRDIVVRALAAGLDPDKACAADVMSDKVEFCTPDQDTQEVMRLMGERQVRRMPVVDTDWNLVGIVALADLALRQPGHIDEVITQISEPINP